MEKRKIEVAIMLPTIEDKPFNFHDIENNTAAQEWLKIAALEMSEDKLFEEVYQIQQEYGVDMRKRRAMRREVKPGENILLTPEMEQQYYDNDARETTLLAMIWLKRQEYLQFGPTY